MLSQFMKTGKARDLVAVDLTGGYVKMLRAEKRQAEVVFHAIREKQFDPEEDTGVSQFLLSGFKEWNIRTRQALCVVPSKLFISKNVDMPSNDPDEISKIIDLQAGRYTPYSRDEIVIDYRCMKVSGQHYTNVLLIIIHRKLIDRYLRIFEQAGIFVSAILIASDGMADIYRKISEIPPDVGALAGIHVGEEASDLTILNENEMVFVRSIPIGASHFKEGLEASQKSFVSELNKSVVAYQDHGIGKAVKGLLMTGLTAGLERIETEILEQIPASGEPGFSIKIIPYPTQFELGRDFLGQLESVGQSSYFPLMAALAKESTARIDLVPKEVKLARRFQESGRESVTLGILLMTCLLMICVSLACKIYLKNNLIAKLETMADDVSTQARLLESASTKTRVLRTLIEHRGKGLYVFDKVISLIGDTVYLSNFSYDQEGNVHLLGTADSMSGVFAFVTQLEESGYFSTVTANETKTRREGGKEVADFDIDTVLIEEI